MHFFHPWRERLWQLHPRCKRITESLGQWGHQPNILRIIRWPLFIHEETDQWQLHPRQKGLRNHWPNDVDTSLGITSKSLMQQRCRRLRLINCDLITNQSVGILIPVGYGLFGFGKKGEKGGGVGVVYFCCSAQILRSKMQRILDSWIWRL